MPEQEKEQEKKGRGRPPLTETERAKMKYTSMGMPEEVLKRMDITSINANFRVRWKFIKYLLELHDLVVTKCPEILDEARRKVKN